MNVMLRCLYGSRLYGTHTTNSDYDYRIATLPDISDLLLCREVGIVQAERDIQHVPVQVFISAYETGQAYAIELAWHVAENYFDSELILDCHPEFYALCSELTQAGRPPISKMVSYAKAMAHRYVGANRRLNQLSQLRDRLFSYNEKSSIQHALDAGLDLSGLDEIIEYKEGAQFIKLLYGNCHRTHLLTVKLSQLINAVGSAIGRFNGSRVTGQGEDWKSIHHALRVTYQAIELLKTSKRQIPLREDIAKWLLDVKLGKIPYEQCEVSLEEMVSQIADVKDVNLDCSEISLSWLKRMYGI